MGAVAAGRRYEEESVGVIDEASLLKDVLARAQQERVITQHTSSPPQRTRPWFPRIPFPSLSSIRLLRSSGLAACGALLAFTAYEYGYHRYRAESFPIAPALTNSPERGTQVRQQEPVSDERLQSLRAQRESLQAALTELREHYAASLGQQKSLQAELSVAREHVRKDTEDLQSSKLKTEQSEARIRELESKLQEATAEAKGQQLALNEIKERLRKAEEETTLAAASGVQDADAKDLFGARDLHIVDSSSFMPLIYRQSKTRVAQLVSRLGDIAKGMKANLTTLAFSSWTTRLSAAGF